MKQLEAQGFSMVEIILSIFITGFILLIFSSAFISFKINLNSKNKVLAYNFAQIELEALQNYPFDKLTPRSDADFVGLAYNFGQQKIANDFSAVSLPQVQNVSPASSVVGENISSIVLLPESYYDDFTWRAYLKILSSSPSGWRAGLVFRYQDIDNFYYYYVTQNNLILSVFENGVETILYSESRIFNTEMWYNLKVVTSSASIQVYLDDALIASVSNDVFTDGHLGFLGSGSTYYNLDNVHLESTVQNGDWNFDSEALNYFPQGFLKVNPIDLPDSQGKLTIENYIGTEVKKITTKVSWQEKGEIQEVQLSTLITKD